MTVGLRRGPADFFWTALRGGEIPASEWPSVIARARSEEVIHALAHRNSSCPDALSIRREGIARHMAAVAVFARVRDVLESTGKPWALLKGLAAAHTLYEVPSERLFSDIDVLVRPEDRQAIEAVLRTTGFTSVRGHDELFVDDQNRRARVDLHDSFVNARRVPSRRRVNIAPDWVASLRRIKIGEIDAPTLSVEHEALFQILHLVHHHGLCGAKWLLDLRLLIVKHPETSIIASAASRSGAAAIAATRFGEIEFSPQQWKALDRLALQAAYEGTRVPAMRFLLSTRDMRGMSDRLGFLVETLLPNPTALEEVYQSGGITSALRHAGDIAISAWTIARIKMNRR